MMDKKQKMKRELVKKIQQFLFAGATFSVSFTFIDYLYFGHPLILQGFYIAFFMYVSQWVNYYLTFKKNIISLRLSVIWVISTLYFGLGILAYMAGGYGGSMIAGFYIMILISAFLLEKREPIIVSVLVMLLYLGLMVSEEIFGIMPIGLDPLIIKYSKAIIDVLTFIIVTFLSVVISQNINDAIKYYQLKSERLSKMKKRLQTLVKRRTKELERSNKKLRELDKKKDEFISIASHELQTPMASIKGFSQLLQDDKTFKDPKKRKKYLKIMEDESTRMSKMVKNMLSLSRIDMGTMKFDVETVNVNGFLEEIGLEMERIAEKKELKLTVHSTKGLPKMRADKEKLRQILINLITNSIKYTEKGSITIDAIKKGKSIQFSVTDTGIGIPEKEQKKIFDRFYQIESPETRKVLGAGLGLSIVREYIRLMGGRIWLESKVGKGSTFYFTLPIKFRKPRTKGKRK
jgi:signal transduction histidine kinase